MFDMMKMMGKVKEAQSRMKDVQEKLVDLRADGESGGGMVKAVVNGKRQVVSIDIDESLIKPEDRDMIQDLVVAAVNNASEKADVLAKAALKDATEGLLPNIPGLDLGGLGGLV